MVKRPTGIECPTLDSCSQSRKGNCCVFGTEYAGKHVLEASLELPHVALEHLAIARRY